jgi:hypothetical protein
LERESSSVLFVAAVVIGTEVGVSIEELVEQISIARRLRPSASNLIFQRETVAYNLDTIEPGLDRAFRSMHMIINCVLDILQCHRLGCLMRIFDASARVPVVIANICCGRAQWLAVAQRD